MHIAGKWLIATLGLIGMAIAEAAVVGTPYYRVSLHQGSYVVGYGTGSTAEAAWGDCDRLATTTRAMTAAETRSRPLAAITANTVRWCDSQAKYYTIGPDPVTCPAAPAPQTRSQACPTGTTGNWTQTSSSSVGPAPTCTVTTTWTPTAAPSGACTVPAPSGTATVSWTHDGNADGYRIVYGATSSALTGVMQVPGSTVRSNTVRNLPTGTLYFAVKAYRGGVESEQSNVVQKVIP